MNVAAETNPGSDCQEFLDRQDDTRVCHLPSWGQTIDRCVKLKSFYFVARDNGNVRGVLPLTQVRGWPFGNRMISQPYSNYGGPLVDDPETAGALLDAAIELATEKGCRSIEFRATGQIREDLPCREGKICMLLPLTADPEELWKNFNAKVRNQVRKAERSGIVAECGGTDLLDEFYELYTIRMHQLGSPAYPKGLMRGLLEAFPDNTEIHVVRMEGDPVGAGFVMSYRGFVEIPWAATRVECNRYCPNNLLYWETMKRHCLAGDKVFDFGRCTVDSGSFRFKKQWGSTPLPLFYQYWTRPGIEAEAVNLENPSYKRKVELWKKLPLWLVRRVGPPLGKKLP